MPEIRAHADTGISLSERAKKASSHSKLEGCRELLGLTHQYTLTSSHGLIVLPQSQGRYYEASRTYWPTAGGRRDTLRPNCLDTMKSAEMPAPHAGRVGGVGEWTGRCLGSYDIIVY